MLLWRGEVYRRGVGPAVSLDNIVAPPERLAVAVVQPGDLLFESGGYTRDTRVSDRDAVIDVDLSDAGPAHALVTRDVEQSLDVVVELDLGTTEELFGGTTASDFCPDSGTDAAVGTTPETSFRFADPAIRTIAPVLADRTPSAVFALGTLAPMLADRSPTTLFALGTAAPVWTLHCFSFDLTVEAALTSMAVTIDFVYTSEVVALAHAALEELSPLGILAFVDSVHLLIVPYTLVSLFL